MTPLLGSLLALVILLSICLALMPLFWSKKLTSLVSGQQKENREVLLAQVELLSKMSGLLASKDPMTYQAIQAMEAPSTSEGLTEVETYEEMVARLAAEQYPDGKGDEELDRIERAIIDDITRLG